ncbi:F0F1 ATP synthase subunit A [Paenibacillus humicola]|uniref:F0F1 ATP synthase subunit A n=1 Tax=Paenibacillus humicola TaxID=3110540 RepID=UPI00237C2081|nr:F0F1 ATP synthase subunit A [Paenibacillus humicola]
MEEPLSPTREWLGMVFDWSTCLMMVVTCALVFLIIYLGTRRMTSKTPKGMQNFLEWVIDFVRGIAGQMMDTKTAERYVGLGLTLFLYVFIANQLGLILNFVTVHPHPSAAIGITQSLIDEAVSGGVHVNWWKSPTATISIPVALAIIILLYTHWLGLRRGVGSYLKSYVSPHWALLPLNLVEELSKFLSFPLRLFGNIFAGEVLLWVLLPTIVMGGLSTVMAIPLIIWIGYSIFVGAIQAFIFTMLTMVYISHRVSHHSH